MKSTTIILLLATVFFASCKKYKNISEESSKMFKQNNLISGGLTSGNMHGAGVVSYMSKYKGFSDNPSFPLILERTAEICDSLFGSFTTLTPKEFSDSVMSMYASMGLLESDGITLKSDFLLLEAQLETDTSLRAARIDIITNPDTGSTRLAYVKNRFDRVNTTDPVAIENAKDCLSIYENSYALTNSQYGNGMSYPMKRNVNAVDEDAYRTCYLVLWNQTFGLASADFYNRMALECAISASLAAFKQ